MHKATICCLMLVCATVVGCTGSGGAARLGTYKVTGKVVMNGAPVPGATVTFSPVESGKPPAMGITDTQGIYILTTYDSGDGAVAGNYKVMVYKTAPSAQADAGAAHDATGQAGASAPQHSGPRNAAAGGSLLPEKYAQASTTTITKTVAETENTLDIEL